MIIPVWSILIACFIVPAVISGPLDGVLATALYDCATTGQVSLAFNEETITSAFGPKPARGRRKKK